MSRTTKLPVRASPADNMKACACVPFLVFRWACIATRFGCGMLTTSHFHRLHLAPTSRRLKYCTALLCDPRSTSANYMRAYSSVVCAVRVCQFPLMLSWFLVVCNAGERWLRDHPEASAKMMDLLTGVVIDYMAAQVRSLNPVVPMSGSAALTG